jgi:5-formyltetrahydrofolate cyclo-ligase
VLSVIALRCSNGCSRDAVNGESGARRSETRDALASTDVVQARSSWRGGAWCRRLHPELPGRADQAAERLAALPAWQQARILKIVPDRAQLPVRVLALEQGKLVYMAAPKLATPEPFYVLDPANLPMPPAEAAEREVIARIAAMANVGAMEQIDLVVVGSVAVNAKGARLGKGAGYSDIELGLLVEAGLVTERTTVCTTVHELQVLDEELPELRHDSRVDLIATPERIVWCSEPRRPRTIDWSGLSAAQIAAIPVLKARIYQGHSQVTCSDHMIIIRSVVRLCGLARPGE